MVVVVFIRSLQMKHNVIYHEALVRKSVSNRSDGGKEIEENKSQNRFTSSTILCHHWKWYDAGRCGKHNIHSHTLKQSKGDCVSKAAEAKCQRAKKQKTQDTIVNFEFIEHIREREQTINKPYNHLMIRNSCLRIQKSAYIICYMWLNVSSEQTHSTVTSNYSAL